MRNLFLSLQASEKIQKGVDNFRKRRNQIEKRKLQIEERMSANEKRLERSEQEMREVQENSSVPQVLLGQHKQGIFFHFL